MLQAHQGYFQADGRLILNNSYVQLPINKKVTIFWEEERMDIDLIKNEKHIPEQTAAQEFLSGIKMLKKENLTTEDLELFAKWDNGEFRVDFEERLP